MTESERNGNHEGLGWPFFVFFVCFVVVHWYGICRFGLM